MQLVGKVVATLLFLRQHAPVPEEFKLGDVNNPETRNMLEQNGISKDEYRRRVSNLFSQDGQYLIDRVKLYLLFQPGIGYVRCP